MSRKQGDKRLKGFSNLGGLDKWINAHHKEEFKYAYGLFDPKSRTTLRIPEALPIATAVATQQGLLTITLNALGNGCVIMDPYGMGINSSNLLRVYNDVGFTETSNILIANGLTYIANNMYTYANQFRVVSAWLGALDLTPALTRTGIYSVGSVPVQMFQGGLATADTIRDQFFSNSIGSQEATDYVGSVFLPMDNNSNIFRKINTPLGNWEVPVIFFTGFAPNANISLDYFINFEYIPVANMTDVLPVALSPVGQSSAALPIAGELRNYKNQTSSMTYGFNKLQNLLDFGSLGLGTLNKGLGLANQIASTFSKLK